MTAGPWDVLAGQPIEDQLTQALGEADTYVVLVSERTLFSPWVFFKLGAAVGGGKKLLIVLLTDYARLPVDLAQVQMIDAKALRPEKVAERIVPNLR